MLTSLNQIRCTWYDIPYVCRPLIDTDVLLFATKQLSTVFVCVDVSAFGVPSLSVNNELWH